MRLLVVSQYFWPENFRINDLVGELVKRGHEVTVLTGKPNYPDGKIFQHFRDFPDSYSKYEGADVVRVPLVARGRGSVTLFLNYISFAISASILGVWRLRGRQFDAIFTCQLSPVTVAIPAIILRAFKKIPMILWVLDLWPESLEAVGVIRSKSLLRLVGVMVSAIYKRSDLILVQSQSFIPAVSKYLKKKIDVLYFPSWSDLTLDNKATKAAVEINIDPSFFNIVFTGNIGVAQDFPAILEAAEKLRGLLKVRWFIVGDGRMAGWLKDQIELRGLQESVFLLGRFPVERMPSFFSHADVLFLALRDEPIFAMTIPGKLQTYMAYGKPVLAMINGEGARVIEESGCGIACPAGSSDSLMNAVIRLSKIPKKEMDEMARLGVIYSNQEFNRNTLISKLELLINQVADCKRHVNKVRYKN